MPSAWGPPASRSGRQGPRPHGRSDLPKVGPAPFCPPVLYHIVCDGSETEVNSKWQFHSTCEKVHVEVFKRFGGTLKLSNMEVDTVTTAPQNKGPQARHWAGCTLNNPTAADEACFLAKIAPIADYYVYGREQGESGTPHFQFMVCFKSVKRLSAVTKLFPNKAHWEMKSSLSTMQQASDYCKKV